MIFETEAAVLKYQNNEYANVVQNMSQYLISENTVFEFGKVWKSSSRKELEDGMNYLYIYSLTCKDGKDWQMENYWANAYSKLAPDHPDWMMYSSMRLPNNKWSFCMCHRIASGVERYIADQAVDIESGPLSEIVTGPPSYSDFWILEGISYPH